MSKLVVRLLGDRRAATAVEYALIGTLLCLVLVGVIGLIGESLSALIDAMEGTMNPPAP
jgi:Flp pilus assembly pilin Flp